MTQFWVTETFGVLPLSTPPLSHEDEIALKILQKTTHHNGERYKVGLMLRNPQTCLPDNREVAVRHFNSLEKRFKRDSAFAVHYSKVVTEYISLGHAKEVDDAEPAFPGAIWYLPHHGVVNPNKPEKVRVVFNPSALAIEELHTTTSSTKAPTF